VVELPPPDVFLASAVQFLVEGGENEAATVLLACSKIDLALQNGTYWTNGKDLQAVSIELVGPRAVVDALQDERKPLAMDIRRALDALMPSDKCIASLTARAQYVSIDDGWREELQKVIEGTGVSNQGTPIEGKAVELWHGLRFRSKTERRIAQVLQTRNALFFPNCRARLKLDDGFGTREPDFLVCQEGQWGILQVDGEPYHGGHTRAKEQNDDRLFQAYGLIVVQHYSANDCWNNTDHVVDQFLRLLRASSR